MHLRAEFAHPGSKVCTIRHLVNFIFGDTFFFITVLTKVFSYKISEMFRPHTTRADSKIYLQQVCFATSIENKFKYHDDAVCTRTFLS